MAPVFSPLPVKVHFCSRWTLMATTSYWKAKMWQWCAFWKMCLHFENAYLSSPLLVGRRCSAPCCCYVGSRHHPPEQSWSFARSSLLRTHRSREHTKTKWLGYTVINTDNTIKGGLSHVSTHLLVLSKREDRAFVQSAARIETKRGKLDCLVLAELGYAKLLDHILSTNTTRWQACQKVWENHMDICFE